MWKKIKSWGVDIMSFGKYKDFKSCEKVAAKKGIKNTGAYCGAIESKIRAKNTPLTKTIVGKTKDGWEKVKVSGNYYASFKEKKSGPDFSGVRKEAQNWVKGMGDQVR